MKIQALQVANDDLSDDPLVRLRAEAKIRPETRAARRPGAEPQPRRPGAIATGPRGVGTVVGSVTGGHRGRQGATADPITARR